MASYLKYFTKTINARYPGTADSIIAEVNRYFVTISPDTRFAITSGNPVERPLHFTGYFLALIKALDHRGESYETIRKICLEIVADYVRPKNKIHLWLKKLPAKFTNTLLATAAITYLNKKISRRSHPDGFVANIITGKQETFGLGYGIDILECGICKLFRKHHYEQYSSILCEVDEITSRLAGLELVRTGTIALGAKKCDFRFRKKE